MLTGAEPVADTASTADKNFAALTAPTELQDTFLPAQLRYQPFAESARVVEPGHWRANATVDWTAHLAQTDTYLFDGESVTSTLRVRYAPVSRWEVGLDIPYTVREGGTADEFIEYVETTLDAKVDARFALPRDNYTATLAGPTGTQMNLRDGHGFQDITVRGKYQLVSRPKWDMAAVGTLALPTGENTFGGDGFSPGLGLHAQRHFVPRASLFGGVAGAYYTDRHEQGFAVEPFRGMTYVGAAWSPLKRAALIVGYQIYTPLAPTNDPLDHFSHYYSLTGRIRIGNDTFFEMGIVENLGVIENRNSSDVTFKFAITANF